jgi:hypothetical protein
MTNLHSGALVCAALLCLSSTAANAAESCATSDTQVAAQAKPKKKKGFGFGSIMKAANQAGLGNMLGYGGMLGNGQMGQVAGAIAGTAVNAASGSADPQNAASHMGGLMGGSRVAQVAGTVTGTAANLARSAPRGERSSGTNAASCATEVGAIVNVYK